MTKAQNVRRKMDKNNLSEDEILTMARDFRNSQNYNYKCQYLLSNDIITANTDYQDLSQGGNTWTLYNNMLILGVSDEIWIYEYLICGFRKRKTETSKYIRSQTHHVIPKSLIGDCSINIDLKSIIDDGRNGIILPTTTNCEYNFALGTAHGNHSSDYDSKIRKIISGCKCVEELWPLLDSIKSDLFNGSCHLTKSHKCNLSTNSR
jgi:hypothetical protein